MSKHTETAQNQHRSERKAFFEKYNISIVSDTKSKKFNGEVSLNVDLDNVAAVKSLFSDLVELNREEITMVRNFFQDPISMLSCVVSFIINKITREGLKASLNFVENISIKFYKHTFNGFNDGEFSLEDNFEHLTGAEFVLAFEEKYGVEYTDSGKYTGVDLTSISQTHIEHLRMALLSTACIGSHPLEDLVKDWNLEHLAGTEFVLAFEKKYGVEYTDSGKYTGVDLTSISQNHIEHLRMVLFSMPCLGPHPLEDLVKDWNLEHSQDASSGEFGIAQVSDANSHDITGKRQEMLFKLFENASGKENSFDTIIEHFCEKMGKEAGEFTPELLADYLDLMIQEFGL